MISKKVGEIIRLGNSGVDQISLSITKQMLSPTQARAAGSQLYNDILINHSFTIQGSFSKTDLLQFAKSMQIDWSDENIYEYMCEGRDIDYPKIAKTDD